MSPMSWSSPMPPKRVSSPASPNRKSLPSSPAMLSPPSPPNTKSLPAPADTISLPPSAQMQSLPPSAKMMSSPAVPLMQSAPAVPKHGIPGKQATGLQPGAIAAQLRAHVCASTTLLDKLKAPKIKQANKPVPRRAFMVSPPSLGPIMALSCRSVTVNQALELAVARCFVVAFPRSEPGGGGTSPGLALRFRIGV